MKLSAKRSVFDPFALKNCRKYHFQLMISLSLNAESQVLPYCQLLTDSLIYLWSYDHLLLYGYILLSHRFLSLPKVAFWSEQKWFSAPVKRVLKIEVSNLRRWRRILNTLLIKKKFWQTDNNNRQKLGGKVEGMGCPSYLSYPSYPSYPSYLSYPSYPSYPGYPSYPSYLGCPGLRRLSWFSSLI